MARTSRTGELERAVLEQLWAVEPGHWSTVREVHDALARQRDIAYTTVMTVMSRLSKKDLVRQQRDGRAYRYQAAASPGALVAERVQEVLEEFPGDRRGAFRALVADLSPADLALLREVLAEQPPG